MDKERRPADRAGQKPDRPGGGERRPSSAYGKKPDRKPGASGYRGQGRGTGTRADAPGSAEKIDSFCTLRYNTKFPRFAKIKVNGNDADPLYVYLKEQKPGRIGWNFAKFLVDRSGNVVGRFAPAEKPHKLESAIEELL